ncbi:hypothetical protein AGDE_15747 [Angomonas deanei]|uniref:Kinase n=1 Tax=Angomonas deanei TaxID=59799 RepID=A0A7G2CLM8_9TRYP|nr:hypothetical protein AGDE_15747 [Angomonas deanei]CAD2220329.1 Inositol polyphosphate kinase, putative [Angomonas deanei]|eukprot:EPY18538.1 hypothetical protein AGDE_15747 [Angomonas deanei]
MTLEELRRVAGRAVADTDPLHRYPHDADNEGEEIPIQLIVLEDVCHGFSYPCVMDMKIGSRQYGLNASERKKKSKNFKARTTCSWEYGIRLAGLRRWDEGQQAFTTKSKLQCRSLTLNEIKDEMTLFFKESRQLELIFVRQLQRLREAFQRQTVYRFYTSSLLFVFDAAAPVQTARIVMVDFAYTYERKELIEANDEDAQYDYDINYIKAIDTLLSLLS